MQTYLVKFADGMEVETDATDREGAQEKAIEYLESVDEVVCAIVSITRCEPTPF